MFVATMNTEHYEFMAVGEDERLARRRIGIGFQEHLVKAKERTHSAADLAAVRVEWTQDVRFGSGADFDEWVDALDEWYGIRIHEFKRDTDVLRDGTRI